MSSGPHRPMFHVGNPFRMLLRKGSCLSHKQLSLLNGFEENLAKRIEKLTTSSKDDVLQLSWLRGAMEQLCGIHADVKALVGTLDLPVSDWTGKWIESYLDNNAKFLDIFNSFTSQIRKLEQKNLRLLRALDDLSGTTPDTLISACLSLNKWVQFSSESPQLDQCFSLIDGLSQNLDPPKADKSGKERVLTQAFYGVQVVTLLLCAVFAAIFSGSSEKLMDIQVPDSCLWGKNFIVLQTFVNTNIRSMFSVGKTIVFRELEAVDAGVKKLVDTAEVDDLLSLISQIKKSSEQYSEGMLLLSKEVDKVFEVLLSERYVLMGKLTVDFNPSKA